MIMRDIFSKHLAGDLRHTGGKNLTFTLDTRD